METHRSILAEEIINLIVAEGKIDRAAITPEATLRSLQVQSIDIVMILMAIEEKFGVYIPIDGPIGEAKDLDGFVGSVADRIIEQRAA
jgi:acyl carrier protein